LGADGIIYGIPENADQILRIIPPEVTGAGGGMPVTAVKADTKEETKEVKVKNKEEIKAQKKKEQVEKKEAKAAAGDTGSSTFMETAGTVLAAGGVVATIAAVLCTRDL